MARLTLRILGCGSSGGVPRVGTGWGACDPEEPRNRRRRCSILVERASGAGRTTLLVDTSPDLREQLLDSGIRRLDGVLYTHAHADHTHGIDDLRPLVIAMRARIPVYADALTRSLLTTRFGYCFETPPGSAYPPILDLRDLDADRDLLIIDALRDTPHPTHFSVSDALALIEAVRPRRAVLTNLHTDLDYGTLAARLPMGIAPAYDGMSLTLDV